MLSYDQFKTVVKEIISEEIQERVSSEGIGSLRPIVVAHTGSEGLIVALVSGLDSADNEERIQAVTHIGSVLAMVAPRYLAVSQPVRYKYSDDPADIDRTTMEDMKNEKLGFVTFFGRQGLMEMTDVLSITTFGDMPPLIGKYVEPDGEIQPEDTASSIVSLMGLCVE